MTSEPLPAAARTNDVLLRMTGLAIEGCSEGVWTPIVKGVELHVKAGEVVGLIGESGAGKSTLGLAAMGYTRAGCRIVRGSVLFDGRDLTKVADSERRRLRRTRIGYVAQSAAASFNPARRLLDQTVESVVRQGLQSREAAARDARDLYARLRLPDPDNFGQRYPHQVSGGQLQRAMTAMAMASRPDLIIFDEPTTALDVTTQVEVLGAIRGIVAQFGTAALYISHDLAVVAQMADRLVVLRHGEVVEEAPTREMLAHPREAYTRSLWSVRQLAKPEAPGEEILLRVENVEARYGRGRANVLDEVTVQVPRGRTVAVVGESGSGKSTLARVVTGLLPPTQGNVWFEGRRLPAALKDRSRSDLKRIQLIYQSADTALNPYQRVRDLIGRPLELFLGLTGEARERRVIQLLEMIDLSERYANRLPGELSGGQKQRVSIARALAAEPALIICDEVTSALDNIVQEEILKLLIRLQTELGIAYLFITHDIETVRAIADEIVVMWRGKVVEQGLKTAILMPPHPPYTELLLSSVPKMDPDWLSDRFAPRAEAAASRPA